MAKVEHINSKPSRLHAWMRLLINIEYGLGFRVEAALGVWSSKESDGGRGCRQVWTFYSRFGRLLPER